MGAGRIFAVIIRYQFPRAGMTVLIISSLFAANVIAENGIKYEMALRT